MSAQRGQLGTENAAAARYDYTFDKLRRLTQEKKRGTGQGTPLHYQKDFSYDKAGNRASYQHQNGGGYNYGAAVNYSQYSYDVMGRLTQIRDTGLACLRVFLLPPSTQELECRLRGRHTDSDEEIARRLETARQEMARQDEFDLRVVNDDSSRAADEIARALGEP